MIGFGISASGDSLLPHSVAFRCLDFPSGLALNLNKSNGGFSRKSSLFLHRSCPARFTSGNGCGIEKNFCRLALRVPISFSSRYQILEVPDDKAALQLGGHSQKAALRVKLIIII